MSQSLTRSDASPLRQLPVIIEEAGDSAGKRFVEFFTAHIRNPHTRAAYARATADFLAWCDSFGLSLAAIEPVHVASYVEALGQTHATATVKQRLAAIRALFDYLVTGQVVPFNPAHAVRGPKLSRETGTTPVLTPEQARRLLDQPDPATLAGARDVAVIALMLYSFSRVSALMQMRVRDYYPQGKRWHIRIREKGGKERTLPVHHAAEAALDRWISAAGIGEEKGTPLFRKLVRGSKLTRGHDLTEEAMSRGAAYQMIRYHAEAAGLDAVAIGAHSMRGTGITTFLENGGALEMAQRIAGHASIKTTKLYDRRGSQVQLSEIERVQF